MATRFRLCPDGGGGPLARALTVAIFTPDASLITKLDIIRAYQNWNVGLYKNDYTPVPASIRSNFITADFTGHVLKAANFGASAINANGQAQTVSDLMTWTKTAGAAQTVYGYFVSNGADVWLLFAERFGTPINLNLNGDTIRLQITDQLGRL